MDCNLQVSSQMFNWVQVRTFTGPLKNIYFILIQPLQCGFSFVFQIIVLLKCESPTQLRFMADSSRFSSRILLYFAPSHCPFHLAKLARPCWWKAAPKHDAATTVLGSKDGVDTVISLTSSSGISPISGIQCSSGEENSSNRREYSEQG